MRRPWKAGRPAPLLCAADLDFAQAKIWVHGSNKTRSRWCPPDAWQTSALRERVDYLRSRRPGKGDDDLPLATSDLGIDARLQAHVCVALNDVMTGRGLSSLDRAAAARATTGSLPSPPRRPPAHQAGDAMPADLFGDAPPRPGDGFKRPRSDQAGEKS